MTQGPARVVPGPARTISDPVHLSPHTAAQSGGHAPQPHERLSMCSCRPVRRRERRVSRRRCGQHPADGTPGPSCGLRRPPPDAPRTPGRSPTRIGHRARSCGWRPSPACHHLRERTPGAPGCNPALAATALTATGATLIDAAQAPVGPEAAGPTAAGQGGQQIDRRKPAQARLDAMTHEPIHYRDIARAAQGSRPLPGAPPSTSATRGADPAEPAGRVPTSGVRQNPSLVPTRLPPTCTQARVEIASGLQFFFQDTRHCARTQHRTSLASRLEYRRALPSQPWTDFMVARNRIHNRGRGCTHPIFPV